MCRCASSCAGSRAVYLGSWLLTPEAIRVLVREIARSPDVGERVDEIRTRVPRPDADDRSGEAAR